MTPAADVGEMQTFYNELTSNPGEVVLTTDPVGVSTECVETCDGFGTTWLLTMYADNIYYSVLLQE